MPSESKLSLILCGMFFVLLIILSTLISVFFPHEINPDLENTYHSYQLMSDNSVIFLLEQDGKLYVKQYNYFKQIVIVPDKKNMSDFYRISNNICEIHPRSVP